MPQLANAKACASTWSAALINAGLAAEKGDDESCIVAGSLFIAQSGT